MRCGASLAWLLPLRERLSTVGMSSEKIGTAGDWVHVANSRNLRRFHKTVPSGAFTVGLVRWRLFSVIRITRTPKEGSLLRSAR